MSNFNITVDSAANEKVISNLTNKRTELAKKVDNKMKDSDMCGRVAENISSGFEELNNIKSEISTLNDALIDFLNEANDGIIEADNSIASWILNGLEH